MAERFSPTGYVARFFYLRPVPGTSDTERRTDELPVVKFDAAGLAMVCNSQGLLVSINVYARVRQATIKVSPIGAVQT